MSVSVCVHLELEQKLQEERSSKLRVENRVLELEKKNSMLDCDYKQSLQKLEELRRRKERLTEEVRGRYKCIFALTADGQ